VLLRWVFHKEKGTQMPTTTEIQFAIMDAICSVIERGRHWPATTNDGIDFTFRMNDDGIIEVILKDEQLCAEYQSCAGKKEEYSYHLDISEE